MSNCSRSGTMICSMFLFLVKKCFVGHNAFHNVPDQSGIITLRVRCMLQRSRPEWNKTSTGTMHVTTFPNNMKLSLFRNNARSRVPDPCKRKLYQIHCPVQRTCPIKILSILGSFTFSVHSCLLKTLSIGQSSQVSFNFI